MIDHHEDEGESGGPPPERRPSREKPCPGDTIIRVIQLLTALAATTQEVCRLLGR